MNVHKNARLTPRGRERIALQVASGQTPKAVSEAAGVCPRTTRKWDERYRREGPAGLRDRSSRPHRLYRPTPQAIVDKVAALRRQRCTGKQIAAQVGVSPATVSRILLRLGLNRLSALEPAEPVRRYERERPGEMIHLDIKSAAKPINLTASPYNRLCSRFIHPKFRLRLTRHFNVRISVRRIIAAGTQPWPRPIGGESPRRIM